jgi:hypothetical protein
MGFFGKAFGKRSAGQITPKRNDQYNTLLNDCLAELGVKNQYLSDRYGLGSHARWDVDQNTGVLTFSNKGIPEVVCDVDFLGSFSGLTNTWLWGWANTSILEPLTKEVLRVKEYGEREELNDLVERKIECTEDEAWAFAAVALWILGGNGFVMMMIKTIRKVNGEQPST